jgi:hypothetical protein
VNPRCFLTLTVSCECGHTKITGFIVPTSLEEITSTLNICRAVCTCKFSGVRLIESLGGPAQFFAFTKELRSQARSAVGQHNLGN